MKFNIYAEHPRFAPDGGDIIESGVDGLDLEYMLAEWQLAYGYGWRVSAQEARDE